MRQALTLFWLLFASVTLASGGFTNAAKQFQCGTVVTGDSSGYSTTSYGALSNSATLTFTATASGNYRVFMNPTNARNATVATENQLQLVATAGSPVILVNAEQVWTQFVAAYDTPIFLEGIYTLTAGTAYTFQLQAKVSSGTLSWKNTNLLHGTAICALQL